MIGKPPSFKGASIGLLGLLLATLAFFLRMPGYDGRVFWVDELWRANLILDDGIFARYFHSPDLYTAITPLFYLGFNKVLALLGTDPGVLRLSSLVPGIASVLLTFAIARRAGADVALACLAALLTAANSDFVRYSNEFKPYMFEVFVHLCCVYVWLGVVSHEAPSRARWALLFGVLTAATLCAANIVFLLPAVGISTLYSVWKRSRTQFIPLFSGFAGLMFFVCSLYVFVWSYGSDKGLVGYWADGFYKTSGESYLTFLIHRMQGLWRGAFDQLGVNWRLSVVSAISLLAVLTHAFTRFRRPWPLEVKVGIMFYATFAVTLVLLNLLSLWPLGRMRPNQFLYAHIIVMFVLVTAWCRQRLLKIAVTVSVGAFVLAGLLRTSHANLADMTPPLEQTDLVWSDFEEAGTAGRLVRLQCETGSVQVFVNPSMGHAIGYFSSNPQLTGRSSMLMQSCVRLVPVPDAYSNAQGLHMKLVEAVQYSTPAWFIYSHLSEAEVRALESVAAKIGTISRRVNFEGAGYFSLVRPVP